jgi:trigger factor
MLKTVEELSPTKKRLKIEIPPDAIEKEIGSELQKVREKSKIPGFRAGKAPMSLIEKRYGKEVESEVLQKLIPLFYSESVTEAALKPISNPILEDAGDFKRNEPFNLTFVVEVLPPIELKYEGVKVKTQDITVTDKEVDDVLESLRQDKAVFDPTEEALGEGDLAVMDYSVKEEEGKSFEGQSFKVGDPSMPPEFSKGLLGKKKGETFDIPIKFAEDYPSKDVAGKELTFHIILKDTKKIKLPEPNDEFAKDFGNDDLPALKEHVKGEILKSKENALKRMQKAEAMRKLLETHEFEAPEGLVEAELRRMVEDAAGSGNPVTGDIKEKLREQARRNVRAGILVDLIGEKEKVSVSEEEIRQKIAEMSRRSSLPPENIIKYYVTRHGSLESLRHAVYEEKVLDLLVQKAELEKTPELEKTENEHNPDSH